MKSLSLTLGGRVMLIPSADQFITAIARHERSLSDAFGFSTTIALQAALAEKDTQYALAARHAFPLPRTASVDSERKIRTFAQEAVFPCVLKPQHFREWQNLPADNPLLDRKVVIVENEQALLEAWHLARQVSPRVIAQELIQGTDQDKRVFVGYFGRGGNMVAGIELRELRCNPRGLGPASVTEPVAIPDALRECCAFFTRLGYHGVCEAELKRDARDGVFKLIEVNPRLTGSGDAAPHAGLDTCWLHYLDLLGLPPVPFTPRPTDFRHFVIGSDGAAIVETLAAGDATLGAVIKSFRGPRAYLDLDFHDPRLALSTLLGFVKGAIRALLRLVKSSSNRATPDHFRAPRLRAEKS